MGGLCVVGNNYINNVERNLRQGVVLEGDRP